MLFDGRLMRLDLPAGPADGDDTLSGGLGDDRIYAGAGQDWLAGGVGRDLLSGMEGDDTLAGHADADSLVGGDGRDTLLGGAGQDVLAGGGGADLLQGGAGRDIATYAASAAGVAIGLAGTPGRGGDAAGDRLALVEDLVGSRFADRLAGDGAPNRLLGLEGNDTMSGGAGNDTLLGGAGEDSLHGGPGADRSVIRALAESTVAAPDRILFFARAKGDRIDLSAIDADPGTPGDQPFAFLGTSAFDGTGPQLRAVAAGGVTRIELDLGDGVADLAIVIARELALLAGDVLL